MSMLFKREFFEPIRQGRKTLTVRLWRRRMVRAGQRFKVPFLDGGRVCVESVEPLSGPGELNESDARADGFESRAAMLAWLGRVYAELGRPGERTLYRVRFRFEPD